MQTRSIGTARIWDGDPSDAMTEITGIQGEIGIAGGFMLTGPKTNRAQGTYEAGAVFARPEPPKIVIPSVDDALAFLQRMWPTAVLGANGRLSLGSQLTRITPKTLVVVPEIAITDGTEEDDAIIFPGVVPSTQTIQDFNAPGSDTAKVRQIEFVAVYTPEVSGVVLAEEDRFAWIGPPPPALAAVWNALPYALTPPA